MADKKAKGFWDDAHEYLRPTVNKVLVGVGGAALGAHVVTEIARQAARDPAFRAKLISKAVPFATRALPYAAVGLAAYSIGSAIWNARKRAMEHQQKQKDDQRSRLFKWNSGDATMPSLQHTPAAVYNRLAGATRSQGEHAVNFKSAGGTVTVKAHQRRLSNGAVVMIREHTRVN